MIRINLLPHRAEKRKRRQIQFISLSIITILLAAMVVGLVYGILDARISYQERRNQYLKNEIAKLDKQIAEIRKLRQQVKSLLARKEVVENLQSTRSDAVHLLDQMLRILPEDVYLRSLTEKGRKVTIVGMTQSNARVSTLMRSIESSPWLDSPHLIEIHAAQGPNNTRSNQFTMTFNLTKRTSNAPGKKG
jgi:type IV pilus assembly protein PilN